MVDSSGADRPPVTIIGAGRAGSALARALHAAGYRIAAIASRTTVGAAALAHQVAAPVLPVEQAARDAELALIAVPDDRIFVLVEQLAAAHVWRTGQQVAHCSGVLPAAVLAPAAEQGALAGGFHPLAAIANRDRPLPGSISFAVEAAEPLRATLWSMARALGGTPFELQPEKRPLYHAAAVLMSNYTVVLAALAGQLLEQAGIPERESLAALLPLLRSTVDNLAGAGLPAALTGPLVRGDAGTVLRHVRTLDQAAPEVATVYRTLATAALPLAAAQGRLDRAAIARLEAAIGSWPLEPAGQATEVAGKHSSSGHTP